MKYVEDHECKSNPDSVSWHAAVLSGPGVHECFGYDNRFPFNLHRGSPRLLSSRIEDCELVKASGTGTK